MQSLIEIEFHLMRPQLAVGLETEIIQVSALTIVRRMEPSKRLCLALQMQFRSATGYAVLRGLAGRSASVVIRGLRDEPRNVPACLTTCGENDVFKHTAVPAVIRVLEAGRESDSPWCHSTARNPCTPSCLMRAIIPLKSVPSLVKVPSAPWTMYFVIVGITMTGSPAGNHCRTLADPCPIDATPIGTRYFR